MKVRNNEVIDAGQKGGLMRFVNHSCDPNCIVEKWLVAGEERCGIFAQRPILKHEEITIDYNIDVADGEVRKRIGGIASMILTCCHSWSGNVRVIPCNVARNWMIRSQVKYTCRCSEQIMLDGRAVVWFRLKLKITSSMGMRLCRWMKARHS